MERGKEAIATISNCCRQIVACSQGREKGINLRTSQPSSDEEREELNQNTCFTKKKGCGGDFRASEFKSRTILILGGKKGPVPIPKSILLLNVQKSVRSDRKKKK